MPLIYSRKVYNEDKEFAKIVERTLREAKNLEHHISLVQEYYPNHTIIELYTYKHSGMCIEKFKRCRWSSNLNGMAAFKNEDELNEKLNEINKTLEEETTS